MIWLPVVGTYADIDVYASIIAYADLLNQRGKTAKTYIPVTPNYSVPDELRLPEWENAIFNLQPNDEAIILDISNPEAIAKFVPDHQILEIIDHHPGYEKYWQTRIGDKAVIEKIGAVATSIFEWWGECWDYDKMSPEIAKLLLGAILDNTLNFNADITTERDHQAASKLAKIAKTTLEDFTNWYFSAVSQTILSDLRNALIKDCKQVTMPAGQERADVKLEVEQEYYQMAANATGISADRITILAYESPLFYDKEGMNVTGTDVLSIVMIVLILGLLAFVVLRSMNFKKEVQDEEELSVESLLQSNPEDMLETIDVETKSDTRKLIEKFVDENPEAAASLLRNWLNEDWE